MIDTIGAAPETREPRFILLLAAAVAPPLFWLGQLLLSYGVTALTCYPADHPVPLATGLPGLWLILFDAVALIAALAGGAVALATLGRARHSPRLQNGRNRFLALWAIFSSLWFFAAILFNTIASVTVPLCAN